MSIETSDSNFLRSMDIKVTPAVRNNYQFFLSHPDVPGRFAWYPTTGALVYEEPSEEHRNIGMFVDVELLVKKIMIYAR